MKKAITASYSWIKGIIFKTRFLWKRIGFALITLVLATIFGFFLIKMIPGDPVTMYARTLSNERRIPMDEAYRLATLLLNYDPSASVFDQFINYIRGLMHGDFGTSMYRNDVNVTTIVKEFLPWTLFISSIALIISFFIGILMGSRMAYKRKGIGNAVSNSYIVISGAIPDYLWGMILIFVFGVSLKWFPIQGNYDILLEFDNWPFIINVLYHAFLPILAFAIVQIGGWALSMRGSAIGVLGEDYIYAAKARGLSERTIISKYLRRNSMLPLITSLAMSFAALFGGAPLIETIFNYPGFGSEFSKAIGMRDYFLIQGLMVFMSFVMILANLIADSLYSIIDPRVRRSNT